METLEEWEQKIKEREQKTMQAFFEYAWDKELPGLNTHYFFSRQLLPDELIVFKNCMIRCLNNVPTGSRALVMRGARA